MSSPAADLAHRLARDAEAVCRHYLSNGRREGRYWLVGDVAQHARPQPVRAIARPGKRQGRRRQMDRCRHRRTWRPARSHRARARPCPLARCRSTRRGRFLSLPRPEPEQRPRIRQSSACAAGSPESARRLFAMSRPISRHDRGNLFAQRGITALPGPRALRFHPRCYYRPDADAPTETWPALIAAVTDLDGRITGAHRTWLDPSGRDKAPIDTPRRAMGHLLGNAVRFGCGERRHGGRRRHRNHAVARQRTADICRWSRRSPPTTSPPSCSRRRCDGSMSRATTIAAGDAAVATLTERAAGGRDRGVARCRRRSATSTRICASSASTNFGQPCAPSSPRRTWSAS